MAVVGADIWLSAGAVGSRSPSGQHFSHRSLSLSLSLAPSLSFSRCPRAFFRPPPYSFYPSTYLPIHLTTTAPRRRRVVPLAPSTGSPASPLHPRSVSLWHAGPIRSFRFSLSRGTLLPVLGSRALSAMRTCTRPETCPRDRVCVPAPADE